MLRSEDYAYIQQLMRERASIMLNAGQEYLVRSRLEPVARAAGLPDLSALVGRLRRASYGALHATVVEAMTTNETSFFRDSHPYETLRSVVVPDVMARRGTERALSLWSAACSTGQEPYSLAILLLGMTQLRSWNLRIMASDISRAAITRARQGLYTAHELGRGMPPRLLEDYFDREDAMFRAKPALRSMIDWRPLNLADPLPKTPLFDVVFMRNVLIYFAPETCRKILTAVHGAMSSQGYLFLGTTENMLGLSLPFTSSMIGRTTVYRPVPRA